MRLQDEATIYIDGKPGHRYYTAKIKKIRKLKKSREKEVNHGKRAR